MIGREGDAEGARGRSKNAIQCDFRPFPKTEMTYVIAARKNSHILKLLWKRCDSGHNVPFLDCQKIKMWCVMAKLDIEQKFWG